MHMSKTSSHLSRQHYFLLVAFMLCCNHASADICLSQVKREAKRVSHKFIFTTLPYVGKQLKQHKKLTATAMLLIATGIMYKKLTARDPNEPIITNTPEPRPPASIEEQLVAALKTTEAISLPITQCSYFFGNFETQKIVPFIEKIGENNVSLAPCAKQATWDNNAHYELGTSFVIDTSSQQNATLEQLQQTCRAALKNLPNRNIRISVSSLPKKPFTKVCAYHTAGPTSLWAGKFIKDKINDKDFQNTLANSLETNIIFVPFLVPLTANSFAVRLAPQKFGAEKPLSQYVTGIQLFTITVNKA